MSTAKWRQSYFDPNVLILEYRTFTSRLINWGLDKMVHISETIFSNALWSQILFGSIDNKLSLILGWQAITRTNDDTDQWRTYT